jgi:hypothetical protein
MQRVSTNLTLFFKFFIPVFWIVFFGAITAVSLFTEYAYVGTIPAQYFRIGISIFFVTFVIMFAYTLMRLKRVEMGNDFVYATNYFKAARYPFHNIEKIDERRFLFLKIVTIYLKTPGIFGKRITFLASLKLYAQYWNANPELYESLVKKG